MYISAEEKRLVDEVFQNAMQVTYAKKTYFNPDVELALYPRK